MSCCFCEKRSICATKIHWELPAVLLEHIMLLVLIRKHFVAGPSANHKSWWAFRSSHRVASCRQTWDILEWVDDLWWTDGSSSLQCPCMLDFDPLPSIYLVYQLPSSCNPQSSSCQSGLHCWEDFKQEYFIGPHWWLKTALKLVKLLESSLLGAHLLFYTQYWLHNQLLAWAFLGSHIWMSVAYRDFQVQTQDEVSTLRACLPMKYPATDNFLAF